MYKIPNSTIPNLGHETLFNIYCNLGSITSYCQLVLIQGDQLYMAVFFWYCTEAYTSVTFYEVP